MSKDTKQKKPKVFLGQNLSTRVRSPYFWTGVVGILGSAVVSFGGLIGVDLSAQVDSITADSSKIIEFVFLALGLFGVSVDPNSKGAKDSEIVRTDYTKPRNDKNPNEFVQWQADADYTRETFEDSNAEEVTESVDGLRDVDQEEIEEEEPEYLEVTEDPSVDNPDSAPLGSNSVETLELDKEAPKSLGDQTPKSKGGEVE